MADLTVFLIVVALRLFAPLLILRFPLPAIIFALVIDAADQTIFQNFTDLNLDSYQSYDKALDVYYLAIAYIATFRNWRNSAAVAVAIGLWYYRLVGVALFELTEWRPLLLIFPNTFEYYFIAIAVIRLRWNDLRLTPRTIVGIAAGIWVFVKLPQEWWIHIAQLDFTDFMKEDLLGVDGTDSWADAFANRPLVTVVIGLVVVALVSVAVVLWRRAPESDYAFTFDADVVAERSGQPAIVSIESPTWRDGLVEKIVLLTLLLTIFARVLPGSTASIPQVLLGVSLVVIPNALVTQWLRGHGHSWSSVGMAFGGNLLVNAGIVTAVALLLPSSDDGASGLAVGFFLFLVSLLIGLFDRYRPVREPVDWAALGTAVRTGTRLPDARPLTDATSTS